MRIFVFIFSLNVILAELYLAPNYMVSWLIQGGETPHIEFTIETDLVNEHVGFGIESEPNMIDAEMIIITSDCDSLKCEGSLSESRGRNENGAPTIVAESIWTLKSMTRINTKIQIIVKRPIKPSNCKYMEITASTVRLIWAVLEKSQSNELKYKYHGSKGAHLLDFNPVADRAAESTTEDYTNTHILAPNPSQYQCNFVTFSDTKLHMVGFELVAEIGFEYLHHAVLYSCSEKPVEMDQDQYQGGFKCGDYTMSYFKSCFNVIAIAVMGSTKFNFPDHVSYPMEHKYALLEVNYHNPKGDSGISMNSGLKLHYEPAKRQYDAGHFQLGATWMFYLPPAQTDFELSGTCSKECLAAATKTNNFDDDYKINIFAATSHGHQALKSIKLSKVSDGKETERIVDEPYYDKMYQEWKQLEKEVVIGKNDDLVVTCTYSTGDKWTRGGLAQTDEMCYIFALYYPRIESISFCKDMTPLEEIMTFFNITNGVANYGAMGKQEEIMVGSQVGIEYLNSMYNSTMTKNNPHFGSDYSDFMKKAKRKPMCTANLGNVFSLERASERTTEGSTDPYLGSHNTDIILDPVIFSLLKEEKCSIEDLPVNPISAHFGDCDYGKCSVSCGTGIKICERPCIGGDIGDYGCPMNQRFKRRKCRKDPCEPKCFKKSCPKPASCLCEVNPVDCPACRSECLNYNGSRYKVKMVCPLDSDRPDKFLVKENKSCKKLNKKFSKLECYNRDPITGCKICNNGKRLPTGCNSCKKFIRGSC